MKKTKQILLGLLLVAGLTGVVAAQQKYEATVPWQKFVGKVLFSGPVEFDNTVDFDSATLTDLTIADDLTVSDDLTVTDDAAVTGDLAVTGTTTFTGGLVSGSYLSASSPQARVFFGQKTLTNAGGAEAVLTVTTAAGEGSGGTLYYKIKATDGTDHQVRTGLVHFSTENKAGTTVSGVSVADETGSAVAVSTGTLPYAITTSNAANASTLLFNVNTSLTATSIIMEWEFVMFGPGTIS